MGYTPQDLQLIATVNDRSILAQCLERSPDVVSGRLPLLVLEGQPSMAVACNRGLDQTTARLCIFAHQDVYLPKGWVDRTIAAIDALEEMDSDWQVAGPYGVTKHGEHVGRIWDVTLARELGSPGFPPTEVESFDELLFIVRRTPEFRFDEALPHFHLYGTDVVQIARHAGHGAYALELPVVHNNQPVETLRGGFARGYKYVRRKWASRLPIRTTVCWISWNPYHLWRAQWRRRRAKRLGVISADAKAIARTAGYE